VSPSVAIGIYSSVYRRPQPVDFTDSNTLQHIVLSKHFQSNEYFRPASFFFGNGRCMFCPGSGTERAQPRTQGSALILLAAFANINIAKG
jgi:hypothetical protein